MIVNTPSKLFCSCLRSFCTGCPITETIYQTKIIKENEFNFCNFSISTPTYTYTYTHGTALLFIHIPLFLSSLLSFLSYPSLSYLWTVQYLILHISVEIPAKSLPHHQLSFLSYKNVNSLKTLFNSQRRHLCKQLVF